MLEEKMKAPEFTLADKDGKMVSLKDFRGKKVVLYFYPMDDTPGCTRQACAFAMAYEGFRSKNTAVIGISPDGKSSHQAFAEKYNLPFILLSDQEHKAISAYDVWKQQEFEGRTFMGVERSTYIIDEEGIIEKVMPNVKPDTNAAEILAYLKESEVA